MLGGLTDRGRGTIMRYDVDILYLNVALGLMTMVSTLRTFGEHRVVFFREAATGLNKWVLLCVMGGLCCCLQKLCCGCMQHDQGELLLQLHTTACSSDSTS